MMMDYRKRMFRGAKIEDCIEDFIQMELTTREQIQDEDTEYRLIAKGMNSAYRYVVNRMVRDFEYKKEELRLRTKFEELEKIFRRLVENNLEQSKKDLYETVQESYYKDDIPEEAMEDLKKMTPDFQKGMFEGMSFAYEQVANYISIMLDTADKLSEKNVHNILQHINKNSLVEDEVEESATTYQEGLANGMKAGFNLAHFEIKGKFQIQN